MEENPRVNEINDMLDLMEDVIEDSKQALLSARVIVDKEEIFDIIKDIRLRLPNEIQQSRWVVEDRSKILTQAKLEADTIIEEAHEAVVRMTRDHDITKLAKEQAQEIINAARHDARELHLGAVEYADNVMKDIEHNLKVTLELIHQEVSEFQNYMSEVVTTVYENRKELKGIVRPSSTPEYEDYEEYDKDE